MEGPTTSQPPPDNAQDEELSKLDLPDQLQKITPATELPASLSRWNSNEEIAAILIAFDRHKEWLLVEPRTRPPSGSLLLYNRKKVSFRRDGYCWKKRRDGKTNREDHMKLKVKGVECIYGSYVHSAILPTFHRRCYWLLQNPHVVLVHYLNVPNHPNNPKPSLMPILSGEMRKKEWTKEELVDQLRPMLASGRQGELHPDQDHTVEETLEAIFQLLVSAQDEGSGPKPLAIDTIHQHPCGVVAPASTFMAHRGVVGLANHHPHVQCAPRSGGKQEVGVLCLQQQSGQLGGCVSTMAHLQVSASAMPDQHHHQVLQNQMPSTAAATVTSATAPLAALHPHQLPMAQHTAVPATTVPSTLSQLTLATFSHVHLATPSASLHTVPVTRESQLHHIAPSPHDATSQTIIPASVNLMPGLSVGDCFQGTAILPSGSVPHPPPSSDSQGLPHLRTFPSAEDLNLLKPSDQLVSSTPQPTTHLQPPLQQHQTTTTCVNGIGNTNAQNQNLNASNVIHLSPTGLVVKDTGNSIGSIANVVAFASTPNNYVSAPHVAHNHPLPGPSKDIPLFAANPLPQTLGNKLLLPSVWGSTPTTTEIPSAQSHAQPVHSTSHIVMSQDSGDKPVVNGYAGVAQGQFQQQQCASNPSDFGSQQSGSVSCENSRTCHSNSASAICDFSPEWAYTEGNTKILVAGPWCNPRAAYTCVFNGKHVSATLVQAGVLRCFTPAHGAGCVVLQVAQDGFVISNSETFEFRAHSPPQQPAAPQPEPQQIHSEPKSAHSDLHAAHMDWFDMNGQQLKQLLLDRLGELERRFISGEKSSSLCSTQTLCMESQESSLLAHIETLTKLQWSSEHMYPKAGCGGLTLLHLASALGYAKLISALIRWRSSNPSPALEFEVDAHSVDNHACTPLMWACAKGQIDAALTLYHWNGGPLRVCNKDGHLPLAVARQRGHHNLATQVEQLEQAHFKAPAPAPAKIRCQNREAQVSSLRPGPDPESRPQPMSPETIKVEQPDADGNHSNMEQATPMQTSQVAPAPVLQGPPGPGKLIRRFSEQVISPNTASHHHPLSKRYSVDLLTSDPTEPASSSSPSASYHMRDSTSEPRLPLKQESEFGQGQESQAVPALNFVLEPDSMLNLDRAMTGTDHAFLSPHNRGQLPMDTDEVSARSDSPFIDVERVSSDDEQEKQDDSKHQMVTLANQIIAAMPERIKLSPSKGDEEEDGISIRTRSESHSSSAPSQGSPRPSSSSFGDDSGISTPMTDSLAFEEYRYTDFGTPASSLSPDSTCLPSPYSPYSFALDSPPPTTAEFTEYFNAPATYMEKDFSQLTLSDQEQRKLYEAAKKRKKNPGGSAQGSRRELERLKKGRNQSVIIQQRFRSHYQRKSLDGKDGAASMGMGAGDAPDSSPPPEESQQCQEVNPSADDDTVTASVVTEPEHVDVTGV
ncbi:hypothetical protein BaRGS_00027388 [Batillaria attramentaria]|uniref:CG-1 domain-containing protein n=1 Tax=Batillaria attramentaria TaxID=370345 RepID=A0ABD0K212_9CAEN